MDNRIVVVGDKSYQVAQVTFGQGNGMFGAMLSPTEINRTLVRHSLNNADSGTRTDEDIDALPYPHATAILSASLDLNGLRKEKGGAQGESRPAGLEAE